MTQSASAKDHWTEVLRGRELLRDGYQVQWTPSRLAPSGAWTMAYPVYDPELMAALYAASTIVGSDYDYLESYKRLKHVPIGSASSSELSMWFTYILRGERFADGHIAEYVESGKLLTLLDRLIALRDSLSIEVEAPGGEGKD